MTRNWDRAAAAMLAFATLILLTVFFEHRPFFDWAFTRHQNTASWVARPLFLLPFCYFAFRRSLTGIMASILALLTSMFWFPAPAVPREDVMRFLAMEKDILSQGWSLTNMVGALAVIFYGWALAAAFWKRSWRLGLGVAAAGALVKSLWSVIFSPEAGHSVLPYAIGGVIVLVIAVFIANRINHSR
ncbi:hypothetical protein [Rhizobium sp. L1K21]|uniref:hypothetical protein n=1 Tax=Rhizobium sp. L1K21 TaxID=2954933 RepID=UPI002092DA91|nr:hypothetical protein [Rhizobium sp. L1K21]MCO6186907.1 hypothetical protein [Rhizobium sp. L1K21]